MKTYCIIISGLPGCGKSTTGNLLADKLKLPILDKDDYLEALFEEKGVGDLKWRQSLSRESDHLFIRDAKMHSSVILVSHWRCKGCDSTSGTPVEWLEEQFDQIIEVYCLCPVKIAAERFMTRKRHPGHRDELKLPEETHNWLARYNETLPLNVGALEKIDTRSTINLDALIKRLSNHIEGKA